MGYVGVGRYPYNSKAFPKAIATSFDSIAVDAGTRVTIYSKPNFEGDVLFDKVGPAILVNVNFRNDTFHRGRRYEDHLHSVWANPLNAIFPPSVREFSCTNMHAWHTCSLVIEGGQSIPRALDARPEYARLPNRRCRPHPLLCCRSHASDFQLLRQWGGC